MNVDQAFYELVRKVRYVCEDWGLFNRMMSSVLKCDKFTTVVLGSVVIWFEIHHIPMLYPILELSRFR